MKNHKFSQGKPQYNLVRPEEPQSLQWYQYTKEWVERYDQDGVDPYYDNEDIGSRDVKNSSIGRFGCGERW